MSGIMDYAILFGVVMGMSSACAFNIKNKSFSSSIFMISAAIAISALVWLSLFPLYIITIPVLIIIIMVFSDSNGDTSNE